MATEHASLDELRIDRNELEPRRRWPWVIVLLLLAAAAGFGFWWFRHEVAVVRTVTARATSGTAARTLLNASGYVTARREATVSSKVTGKVVEVLVEEGMKVKSGQVLARLDDVNLRASMRLAEAQLEAARTALNETQVRLHQAGLELKRITQLLHDKVASQAELDAAEAEVNSLEARLENQRTGIAVAEGQLAVWKQELEDTIIRAPFDGVVTSKNAQPGEMISPISAGGGFTRTGICTVVDMTSLEIEVDVNESFINRVEAGQTVEARLDAYPEWKIPGKVIAIIPTADRQRSTVGVRVGFESLDPRILPQMAIKVAFLSTHEDTAAAGSIAVPLSALRRVEGRDTVFVLQEGKAEPRAVTLAATGDKEAAVISGLRPGDKVIVEGPTNLVAGLLVREAKP
jgi:RND family efflux transporter MFP subunit